jgi:hypothetical protein
MRGKETVVVERAGAPDWQGDPTGATTTFELTGCQLWPRSSTEDSARGRVILEGWNVYVPPPSEEVLPTDVLVIRGERHNVEGVPGRYDLKGRDKGTIIVTSKEGR